MGHAAVLAVAIGIFVGTLSLGRHTAPVAGSLAPPALVQGLHELDANALVEPRGATAPIDKA